MKMTSPKRRCQYLLLVLGIQIGNNNEASLSFLKSQVVIKMIDLQFTCKYVMSSIYGLHLRTFFPPFKADDKFTLSSPSTMAVCL